MNQNPGDHWRNPGGPPPGEGPPSSRPFNNYGPNGHSQPGPVLPPPPSGYHHQQQPSGSHNLSIADLTQAPPSHSQYNTQPPPPPSQSHSISSMSNSMPHQSPDYLNRDREMRDMRARDEMREREMREREMREREHNMMREREARDRERDRMDRVSREQPPPPVQSHASIPIHQPVASKVQGALQGPNGLLGNGGSGPPPTTGASQAPQSGLFGLPHDQQRQAPYTHQQQAPAQQTAQPFMGGPSPMAAQAQLAHGQQPILNDALSYLDQVKVRFSDQPDVYNRFLDIMKDFKSQAIDTPGVINRVSELFNGHPALIQGFNTFLPPGYRIECGTDENPDAIRVTTPSGTMTQSLQSRGRGQYEAALHPISQTGLGRQDNVDGRGWGQQISPGSRPAGLPGYEQAGQANRDRADQESALQQDQRGVSQLQNAVSAAANGQNRPGMTTSPPPGQQGMFPQGGSFFGTGDMKRGGPVEFNHAISYVNKIKNRFAQQPEIYKQFLEILQTYQRESKPIQDVYSQVTQLFISAPDLLEDFTKFLPETAAHTKSQPSTRAQQGDIEMSNVRGDAGYAGQAPQTQTPRPAAKMPPMGQFDPPSTSKENKKRKATSTGINQTQSASAAELARMRGSDAPAAHTNKRQKFDQKQRVAEAPAVSSVDPTLVPALPEPLPPAPSASVTQEELGFFDRAKKQIGNRASYAEFLKLINLFTQDLIDKYTLADRVQSFIGSNADLMSFFRSFLGIEEHEEIVEAKARPDAGRVNLSHCRAFGPSYRHLPKRDQTKTCKGRDGMCYEVLNDVWASHPTWASEDSGFVAHRKNQYEEALHRIEEERHDYDFHIECCQRTIQLMEPIVQQINVMSEADRAVFQVERGLGGASEAIPKRIILKIYGREVGNRVVNDMYERPANVLPVVLNRLKQKLEEWKQVQREWEKVWREQINKQFWKSLDHQGINTKNIDKKNFQQKTLTSEIQAKYEEQKRSRDNGNRTKKHQLEYYFKDNDVLAEATQLILTGLESDKNDFNGGQQTRIKNWLQDFVTKFYGLDKEKFVDQIDAAMQLLAVPVDEIEEDAEGDTLPSASRSKPAHKGGDWLRRAALERRNGKEDSVAPTSKESTPAPEALSEMEGDTDGSPPEPVEKVEKKWINMKQNDSPAKELSMDEPYEHTNFNFYANANIYCFFRLFEMLYNRLLAIKSNEASVEEAVRRWKGENMVKKPALSLHMIDKTPEDFFKDVSGGRDYYSQVLEMCGEILMGRIELAHLEETLRRYYNKSGWQLYTVDKLIAAILRFIMNILGGDAKDKSLDITNLFFRDRERQETTRKQELQYRKQVEKMSKDGEVYRITWIPSDQLCTIRLFPPDDSTFDSDSLTEEARWQYYIASYSMTDPTEGVDQSKIRRSYLQRSIAPQNANIETAYAETYANLDHYDEQSAFIDVESYKLHLNEDFILSRNNIKARKKYNSGQIEESEAFKEKFVRNVAWMKDQRTEDVEARKAAWDKGVKEGLDGFEEQFAE